MDKTVIERIQGFGFDVYVRGADSTYLFFTDGTRIGYVENNRLEGLTLSTVHKPNSTTGTAFGMGRLPEAFTKEDLERAFATAPGWADSRQRASVVKYKNLDAFLAKDSFAAGYKLVDATPATETRFFAANVRQQGAQGKFSRKVFELVVTVTGSHHKLMNEAIALINAQGFEVQNVVSHSAKRDCL